YVNKGELDLNNRLIAKFEIPNSDNFWEESFSALPFGALYPTNDKVKEICDDIRRDIRLSPSSSSFGTFLQLWATFEEELISNARNYRREVFTARDAIKILLENDRQRYGQLK